MAHCPFEKSGSVMMEGSTCRMCESKVLHVSRQLGRFEGVSTRCLTGSTLFSACSHGFDIRPHPCAVALGQVPASSRNEMLSRRAVARGVEGQCGCLETTRGNRPSAAPHRCGRRIDRLWRGTSFLCYQLGGRAVRQSVPWSHLIASNESQSDRSDFDVFRGLRGALRPV